MSHVAYGSVRAVACTFSTENAYFRIVDVRLKWYHMKLYFLVELEMEFKKAQLENDNLRTITVSWKPNQNGFLVCFVLCNTCITCANTCMHYIST